MVHRNGFLYLVLLVLVTGCTTSRNLQHSLLAVPAGEYVLPVLETTDVHGTLVNTSTGTTHYRLAYIADKANDIRGRGKDYDRSRLLLLDGGDIYQGTVLSNMRRGQPMYVAFDKMDYDAVALGNHEFDWGFETMVDDDATLLGYTFAGKHSDNPVPVLCANLYRHGKRTTTTRDYIVLDKTATSADGHRVGVKIGVIGMADYQAKSMFKHQFLDKGYSIPVDYARMNTLADSLERSGSCDATVLLVHGQADEAAQALGQQSVIDLVRNYNNVIDSLALPGSGGRASTMGNWMSDLVRRIGDAEIGFVNNGGVRTSFPLNGAAQRNITVSNVYEVFPFDNLIYVYELTYADLLTLLEYSMTKQGAMLLSRQVGIDCYLTVNADESYTLRSLVKDGTTIYADGRWTEGWADRTVRVAVSQFVATSNRVDKATGLHNPLLEWNNTPRLKSKDRVDNEHAVRILTEEARRNGGLLSVDVAPHFIAVP